MADHIRIGDIAPRIQYAGDGTQAVFAYPFPIFADADLVVYLDDALQVSGYAVGGTGNDAGGTVSFDTAPADGAVVTLVRNVAIARTSDFQESGEFRAKIINDELDREVAMIQQVNDRVARSLRLSETDGAGSLILPDKATRAGQLLGFDADGNPIAAAGSGGGVAVSGFMATVVDDGDAAAARSTLGMVIGTDVLAPDGDGSGLTGVGAADQVARDNTVYNAFEIARIDGLSTYAMVNTVIDAFVDESGVDTGASSNQTYDASGAYYHNPGAGPVDATGKTYGGDFSGGGGNAAVYDGDTAQTYGGGTAGKTPGDTAGPAYASVDWGASNTKSIVKVVLVGPTDHWWQPGATGGVVTFTLQGSSDNFSGSVVDLGSVTGIPNVGTGANGPETIVPSVTTAYRYHRIKMQSTVSDGQLVIGEASLYEAGPGLDMTLVSEAIAAAAAPSSLRAILDHAEIDALTLNTDCTIEGTRDGGTSWTAGTLTQTVNAGSGRQTLAADIDVSGQPSGSSVKWRFKALNNKEQRLHKIGVQADQQLTI